MVDGTLFIPYCQTPLPLCQHTCCIKTRQRQVGWMEEQGFQSQECGQICRWFWKTTIQRYRTPTCHWEPHINLPLLQLWAECTLAVSAPPPKPKKVKTCDPSAQDLSGAFRQGSGWHCRGNEEDRNRPTWVATGWRAAVGFWNFPCPWVASIWPLGLSWFYPSVQLSTKVQEVGCAWWMVALDAQEAWWSGVIW